MTDAVISNTVDKADVVNIETNDNSDSVEHTSILEYLTNPSYYSILNKNNKTNMIKETNNKEDVRFYRKRIIALTKEMLKGDIPSNGIKEAHDDYVNILIKYFKIVDKTDIIQDQYDKDINTVEHMMQDMQDIQDIQDIQGFSLRSKAPSLDNYVVKTNTIPETRIIPIKLEVDLTSSSLKTKGIKPKKVKKIDV